MHKNICGKRWWKGADAEFRWRSVQGLTEYWGDDETVLKSTLSDGLCQARWQRAAHLNDHCQTAGGKWSGLYVIRPAVVRLAGFSPCNSGL
jgi:hypothetical protein